MEKQRQRNNEGSREKKPKGKVKKRAKSYV